MENLQKLHDLIIRSHIARFELFYDKYFQLEESRALVHYFFNRIYTLEGKHERDEIAQKTYERFKSVLSEKARGRIEKLMGLNRLTDDLDIQMAKYILENAELREPLLHSNTVSAEIMKHLYLNANERSEREHQLELILENLQSFFELSKHPLAEYVMKPASMAAKMVGAKKIYQIFEEGYLATKPVGLELFTEFIGQVKIKEREFLQSMYTN